MGELTLRRLTLPSREAIIAFLIIAVPVILMILIATAPFEDT